ncbi:MAG: hypothetical protein ACC656_14590 [Candidatus Heimdallarchaeota archaeon]
MNKKKLSPSKIKRITGASYHESVPFPFYYSPPILDNLRDLIQSCLASNGGRPTLIDKPVVRKVRFSEEGWDRLENIAKNWSKKGSCVSPAQIASILIEQIFVNSKQKRLQ